MKITICIGSSCHVKGSRQVVKQLQQLISEHGLDDKVSLSGTGAELMASDKVREAYLGG